MLFKKTFLIVIFCFFCVLLFHSIAICDDNAQQYFKEGHLFYLASKPIESEIAFRKAIKLDPTLSDAYYYLSSIYFKQNKYTEAIVECREALKINPDDVKSMIILGLSLQQLELNKDAIEVFQKAKTIDRNSAAINSALGLVYCKEANIQKSLEQYEVLKSIDSELADDLLQEINQYLKD